MLTKSWLKNVDWKVLTAKLNKVLTKKSWLQSFKRSKTTHMRSELLEAPSYIIFIMRNGAHTQLKLTPNVAGQNVSH